MCIFVRERLLAKMAFDRTRVAQRTRRNTLARAESQTRETCEPSLVGLSATCAFTLLTTHAEISILHARNSSGDIWLK